MDTCDACFQVRALVSSSYHVIMQILFQWRSRKSYSKELALENQLFVTTLGWETEEAETVPWEEKSKLRRVTRKITDAGILRGGTENWRRASSDESSGSLELGDLAATGGISAKKAPEVMAAGRGGRERKHSSESRGGRSGKHVVGCKTLGERRRQCGRIGFRIHDMRWEIYAMKPICMCRKLER